MTRKPVWDYSTCETMLHAKSNRTYAQTPEAGGHGPSCDLAVVRMGYTFYSVDPTKQLVRDVMRSIH